MLCDCHLKEFNNPSAGDMFTSKDKYFYSYPTLAYWSNARFWFDSIIHQLIPKARQC
jgi:hypothetical protein